MKWWNPFRRSRKHKALQSVDDRSWTRIFDWRPGAWQQHTPYDTDESVLAHPTVFSCHTLIQGDIGKLRPTVQKLNNGIWEETEHPIVKLLKKPNTYQNHIQFKQYWLNSKLNHGNTYVLKVRDPIDISKIVGLQILDPLRVTPLVADNGDVYYRLEDDRLSGITEHNTLPASEIIHDRFNCFYHALVGLSPIFAAGQTSTMGLKIINNSRYFFQNGARPSGVLTAPGSISESTANRLKKYWQANFKGEKTGDVAVAGDGLKYEPMVMSSVDAQLLEQLNWSDEKIASCFHVPAYKVGAGPIPTNNNVEALTLQYYSQCLQILIESMEACLDDGLGITRNHRIQFDLDALFRMDQKTLMDLVKAGREAAVYAPDEGRKRFNLPPVPGGKYPYLQQQNYSLEALAKRDANDPFAKPPPPEPPSEEPDEDLEMLSYLNRLKFMGKPYKNGMIR